MKMAAIGSQGAASLGAWPCESRFGIVGGGIQLGQALRFQKLKPGLGAHSIFLVPADPGVELSAPLLLLTVFTTQCLPYASMLAAVIMN